MNHRLLPSAEYPPSPSPSVASSLMLSMLKLNVTVYFTPAMPFVPPALTATPQKVVDILQIMVVMTPDKSVSHLKQQIAKTISIISKDENLPFSSHSNLCSIRNSQNYVAHNDMILGHAFIHNECIYAIILSDSSRPFQYMASPASHIRPSARRHAAVAQQPRQGVHHHRYQSNTDHAIHSARNISGSQNRRVVEGNSGRRNDEHDTTSEGSNDSEDTYESSFVEKDDREGFLDLEAEESDGSETSLKSPSPEYRGHSMPSSTKKLSLNELKRRRKNVIQVSESEDDLPTGFKSHSHYVASLIDKVKSNEDNDAKMTSQEQINNESRSDFKDDKEIDDSIVRKDFENNQSNAASESLPLSKSKAILSSDDESSESSEQEMGKKVGQNQSNQIARDIDSDSGSDSESSSSSGSQNDFAKEVNNETKQNNALKEKKIEKTKVTEASNSKSESDETEDGFEMNAESSKISKQLSKKSSKRKYSSLSEIASNASNHSTSSKPETKKKQSSSSSPSSSSSESDLHENKGKRVKSSSLRSLSKDVSTPVISKKKSVSVKPKQIKSVKKKEVKLKSADKSKHGNPISSLLNGSSEFQAQKREVSSSGEEK